LTSTHRRVLTKLAGGGLAALLSIGSTAALLPGTASANQATTSTRVAGTDRYATAAAIAQASFATKQNRVVLASGEAVSATDNNSPDALSASGLAGAASAPMLLTAKNSLPSVTANALGTLTNSPAATTIYVVGGTAAISQAVRDQLKSLGYTLVELSGTDRYDTSSKVATQAASLSAVGTFNGGNAAILATGEGFADALSAGPVAYKMKYPVLLTPSASLGSNASASITSLGITRVIIMGGTAAISQANEDAVKAKSASIQTTRMAGTNRFDTAAKLATLATTTTASSGIGAFAAPYGVVLANGLNFPDALAGAQLGALGSTTTSPTITAGPMLLTASIPAETNTFLTTNKASISTIAALGGTAVISDADITAAKAAATTATPTATITASQGLNSFTVTFSEGVTSATAGLLSSYTRNNAAISGAGAGVVTSPTGSTTGVTSATVTLPTGVSLAAGDTVTATTAIKTADGRSIAATSVTVASDVAKPSATILPYVGKTTVWVHFSEPIATSTFTPSDLTVTGTGTIGGGASVQFFDTVDTLHARSAKVSTAGVAFLAGDVVNSAATTYKDAANNDNTASSGTAINDTTAPSGTSAKVFSVAVAQASQTTTGTGKVTVTANKGGAADGILGNDWKLVVSNAEAAPSVAVNSGTKTVTISADLDGSTAGQPTASTVSNALNANSAFTALFTSTVNTTGNFDATLASTNLANGANSTTITVTFSEAIDPTTATTGNFGLDTDGNNVSDVAITSVSTAGFKSGVIVLSITQTGGGSTMPVAGTSKVTIATGVTDLAGNGNLVQTTVTLSA
jgi:putative cell wall-binding protein